MNKKNKVDYKAIISIILGILSIVVFVVVGIILGALAIILANKTLNNDENDEISISIAKAGKITGILGVIISTSYLILIILNIYINKS